MIQSYQGTAWNQIIKNIMTTVINVTNDIELNLDPLLAFGDTLGVGVNDGDLEV